MRTTVVLQDGAVFIFQEAMIANFLQAYIMVKTHPAKRKVILKGKSLTERKDDYAKLQLIEEG